MFEVFYIFKDCNFCGKKALFLKKKLTLRKKYQTRKPFSLMIYFCFIQFVFCSQKTIKNDLAKKKAKVSLWPSVHLVNNGPIYLWYINDVCSMNIFLFKSHKTYKRKTNKLIFFTFTFTLTFTLTFTFANRIQQQTFDIIS